MKKLAFLLMILISFSLAQAAIILEYNETDLVDLEPEASDEDDDELQYSYSPPLDEEGRWQTDYGDAGEYTVTVTVSDGELTSSEEVVLNIDKKEVAPEIISYSPS